MQSRDVMPRTDVIGSLLRPPYLLDAKRAFADNRAVQDMPIAHDRIRHPEKRNRPDSPIQRKPAWIRVKAPVSREYHETRQLMRALQHSEGEDEDAADPVPE